MDSAREMASATFSECRPPATIIFKRPSPLDRTSLAAAQSKDTPVPPVAWPTFESISMRSIAPAGFYCVQALPHRHCALVALIHSPVNCLNDADLPLKQLIQPAHQNRLSAAMKLHRVQSCLAHSCGNLFRVARIEDPDPLYALAAGVA